MAPARCYECNEICEYVDTKFSRTRLCHCSACEKTWEEIITEIPRPINIQKEREPMVESHRPLVISISGVLPRR